MRSCQVSAMARLRSWSERTEYYTEMYENSFFIADIYESFALLVLGHWHPFCHLACAQPSTTFLHRLAQDVSG